jgi:hypothetical protein
MGGLNVGKTKAGRMKPRARKCKIGAEGCDKSYLPFNSMQTCCRNPFCALEAGRLAREKKARIKSKADKERIKSKADWMREAQTAVNAYVRARDKGKPCISCDKPDNGSHQRHASHYRSVGACSQLRFNTWNIWASCAQCNGVKSGNLIEYRIRLVPKLGATRVDWLESQNGVTRYSIEYLQRIKKLFAKRARMTTRRKL